MEKRNHSVKGPDCDRWRKSVRDDRGYNSREAYEEREPYGGDGFYGRDELRGRRPYRGDGAYRRRPFRTEGSGRPLPRRMRERGAAKKRREICFLILCLLLGANLLLLLDLRYRIGGLDRTLDQTVNRTASSVREEDSVPETESQTREDVPNPTYGSAGSETGDDIVDYVSQCGLAQVDMPMDRSPEEVLVCLQELSQDNEQIAEIYKQHSRYSDDMLKALANNPEMADFVMNSLDRDARPSYTGLSELERSQDYPLFLQWDPRWGYESYGDDNIGLSGCGPTCVSMAMYYLLGDESITPDAVARYSMDNGHYVMGTGTAWALLEEFPETCGVSVEQPAASEQTMKNALDKGGVIICSMSQGDFTAAGHFVVIYGYDSDGFFVNDSNCVARSREKWEFRRLEWPIKHMWVYYPMQERRN
nr:C39 family peptidase [uncultured Acetatifactor sp.]